MPLAQAHIRFIRKIRPDTLIRCKSVCVCACVRACVFVCVRACVRGGGGAGWRGHLSGVAVHPCLLGGVRPPFGGRRWGVLDVQPPPQLVHRRLPLALEVDVQQEAASSADPRRPPDVLAAEQGAVPVTNTQHTHYNNISNRGESHKQPIKLKNI